MKEEEAGVAFSIKRGIVTKMVEIPQLVSDDVYD